ncbi:MAG: slipin family protein [Candidatus Margulisiibacteriota bacterium]|nr:MAG: band 7 domain-containing protein [Candidatus Margulisbacteria bacterium GWD2_39_127]OGI01200.1 MAG: band 7 domain-containing protein [Candidatus Margulisbacteria bacterium GWF2_38_17]OGI09835.1 MAG: band 7 domain-containing protein [Candidatus Margulisbacteria bacterium GWE2_39_32]PZM78424.1 MAG: slipin family protein [Candidatus Margulisiibacteriota bacterium]HAR64164.1 band 7 domain-containing protein [Candidatus Margulisiibacteriota bacterium]
MFGFLVFPIIIVIITLIIPGFRIVNQYEKGVVFRFGKIIGFREPGLNWIIPYVDIMRKVDFRIITLPIPPQKIITKDNVSVDISAVAYFQVTDAIKSIVAIADVRSAIDQIAQTTVRNITGRFLLDEVLSERDSINKEIRTVLDQHTEPWGVIVSLVEIKDIELPENMQRAMAKQAEAEREKRAKIIAAEGEYLSSQKLGDAADVIAAHPIALQLRNLQTLAEISTEKNSTIIFPAQLMSTINDMKKFIDSENSTLK